MNEEFDAATSFKPNKADWLDGRWSGFAPAGDEDRRGDTAGDIESLREIGLTTTSFPDGFSVHRTLGRILKQKRKNFEEGTNIDWASAEALAFGALLKEGYSVRLSGQDSRRGTFSQRHAVFIDQETEETHSPLQNLRDATGTF